MSQNKDFFRVYCDDGTTQVHRAKDESDALSRCIVNSSVKKLFTQKLITANDERTHSYNWLGNGFEWTQNTVVFDVRRLKFGKKDIFNNFGTGSQILIKYDNSMIKELEEFIDKRDITNDELNHIEHLEDLIYYLAEGYGYGYGPNKYVVEWRED